MDKKSPKLFISISSEIEFKIFKRLVEASRVNISVQLLSEFQTSNMLVSKETSINLESTALIKYFKNSRRQTLGSSPHNSELEKLLSNLSVEEAIYYDQMQRVDWNHNDRFINFRELWQQTVVYFNQVLLENSIDFVYITNTPHEILSWPLYSVCKYLKIPFYFFQDNHNLGTKSFVRSIEDGWVSLVTEGVDEARAYSDWKIDNCSSLKVIEPAYLSQFEKTYEQNSKDAKVRILNRRVSTIIGEFKKAIHESRNLHLENVRKLVFIERILLFLGHFVRYLERILRISQTSFEYQSLVKSFKSIESPCIVFFLSYLPEMAVNPLGYPFLQHKIAVSKLASVVPPNFRIYLKEHPAQIYGSGGYHYLGRYPGFYKELLCDERFSFIPNSIKWREVLESCDFVATISGTIGWQSIKSGVPAIVFGRTWYEDAVGIIKSSKLTPDIFSNPTQIDLKDISLFAKKTYLNTLCFAHSKEEAELIGMAWDPEQTYKLVSKCIEFAISENIS